ncbi:MAG: TIGR02444 family protein [Asticcacaulis sp.]
MTEAFWDWAVRAYGGEGIADLCLELQDTHGQNVPLLLFAVWAGVSGVLLDEEAAEAAVDVSRAYAENVVEPLRTVRRKLKKPLSDMADTQRERLRQQVKALELEAERAQMTELAATLAPSQAGRADPVRDNVIAVAKAWARIVPRNPLMGLCDALSERGFLSYNA